VSGDIVITGNAESQATVTFYVTQGRDRSQAITLAVSAVDIGLLAQRTAEMVLGQVNPYVLASYLDDHQEFDKAVEIVQRIAQNPPDDCAHISAAFALWSNLLYRQKKEECIFISAAYNLWGVVLYEEKNYDGAVAKYQKAVELDPKSADAYAGWGVVLYKEKNYDGAVAKYQKAIELDPKYAGTYINWGVVLYEQKNYAGAVAKYQKAIELDPKYAAAYNNCALALEKLGRHAEAEEKFAKAREILSSQ
jgi:superkiller protein 3